MPQSRVPHSNNPNDPDDAGRPVGAGETPMGDAGTDPAAGALRVHAPSVRRRMRHRAERLLAMRTIRDSIVSLAGLIDQPVRNQSGQEVGRLKDVVCRWSDGQTYPPVTGVVVKVGRRLAFVDAAAIDAIEHSQVLLRSARLDLRDFTRRTGEVTLVSHVLDHQLVDVDGVQVVRAADLYLAPALGRIRLVGVDVSVQSLLRRLGPARWRPRPTPEKVIDWAAIQPFGELGTGGPSTSADAPEVRLRSSNDGLQRLRPGELADLLEDLRRPERQELLASLPAEEAADALEEMDPEELASLLHEAEPTHAATLLAEMEPDEAVDALRDLDDEDRTGVLAAMPETLASHLEDLLRYPEDQAGGFMTTIVAAARTDETVAEVTKRLAEMEEHRDDLDAVAVVDATGCLVGDVPLFDLLVADAGATMATLLHNTDPITVGPGATLDEVAERLVEARRLSVVVVENDRPIGRILADDVLDAFTPERGRLHFPRFLQ